VFEKQLVYILTTSRHACNQDATAGGGQISTFTASRPALGPTKLLTERVPGVKQHGREADHLPTSTARGKNGVYLPPPPISLHDVVFK
jgi:hypothetical protein